MRRGIGGMIAKAGRVLDEVDRFCPAFHEMIHGALGRAKPVARFDLVRGLHFGFTRGNVFSDGRVNGFDLSAGGSGSKHHLFDDETANLVFRSGDMFHAFSGGPAIGNGLEIPLCGRESFRGPKNVFLGRFEILDGFVSICL
jgi:hypothetical protein